MIDKMLELLTRLLIGLAILFTVGVMMIMVKIIWMVFS